MLAPFAAAALLASAAVDEGDGVSVESLFARMYTLNRPVEFADEVADRILGLRKTKRIEAGGRLYWAIDAWAVAARSLDDLAGRWAFGRSVLYRLKNRLGSVGIAWGTSLGPYVRPALSTPSDTVQTLEIPTFGGPAVRFETTSLANMLVMSALQHSTAKEFAKRLRRDVTVYRRNHDDEIVLSWDETRVLLLPHGYALVDEVELRDRGSMVLLAHKKPDP